VPSVSAFGKKGFTLIELLVVVLIIGILAGVALPQYETAVQKSRWMGVLTKGRALLTAQQAYYMANGVFADDLTLLDISLPEGGTYSSAGGLPNSVVSYPNGEYYRNTGSTYIPRWGSAFLWAKARGNKGSSDVHLLISYSRNEIQCRAGRSDRAGTSVCLSMGGKPSGPCDEGNDCVVYKLQ